MVVCGWFGTRSGTTVICDRDVEGMAGREERGEGGREERGEGGGREGKRRGGREGGGERGEGRERGEGGGRDIIHLFKVRGRNCKNSEH